MKELFRWRTASPESQGMSGARLDAWRDVLASRGTRALLVVRHDRIVYEWYAPDHGPSQRHYTASLAKALVGGLSLLLALNDRRLNADDAAWKYIPAWKDDPEKSKITIRHLATHSSGIEDATTTGMEKLDPGGWKTAFWRLVWRDWGHDSVKNREREEVKATEGGYSDAFSIAIHQASLLFPPGTQYAYSNPGFAALAYVVTASLRGALQPDIRTLLRERIMDPIGVAEDDWFIGYGRAYVVDDMKLYANWGGGEYTARAVARVGRLMLRRGDWEGRQLVDADRVDEVLSYAGTPLPDRPPGNPQPASALGWWTNFDGVWPSLPRDAFAGAGAGNQILLAIPCRDLIVVRNGEHLGDESKGDGFWGGLETCLFSPLMDAFLDQQPGDLAQAPYPSSEVIRKVTFAPPSSIVRRAFHSDNWPITWADDDHLYTAYGDGRGFEPYTEKRLGLGFAKIMGPSTDVHGVNVRSRGGENLGYGPNGAKASGMLMVDGTLYMWARNTDNSQLAWSSDHSQTWTWSDWRFTTSFGHPTFLNFGQNYAGARDEYVYTYSHDANSAYSAADRMVLARVPKDRIGHRDAYEFFRDLDREGSPLWTEDIHQRGSVFTHPGACYRSGISYNAGLGRYLWYQIVPGGDTRFEGGFGLYDAPEPWGPWTTVYFTTEWDVGPGEMGAFPTKWMSADGKTCYLVFSGNDYFSVREVRFSL
jgi:CubicO group peptidase (beta-lactamase class C family)